MNVVQIMAAVGLAGVRIPTAVTHVTVTLDTDWQLTNLSVEVIYTAPHKHHVKKNKIPIYNTNPTIYNSYKAIHSLCIRAAMLKPMQV